MAVVAAANKQCGSRAAAADEKGCNRRPRDRSEVVYYMAVSPLGRPGTLVITADRGIGVRWCTVWRLVRSSGGRPGTLVITARELTIRGLASVITH